MKKWIIIFLSVLLIYVALILLLIPYNQNLTIRKNINFPGNAIVRLLHDKERLKKCWPDVIAQENDFTYKEASFHLDNELINGIGIMVEDDGNKIYGTLEVIGMENTQCQLVWTSNVALSKNPFLRTVNYFQFKSVGKKLTSLLEQLSVNCNKMENIYDAKIDKIHIEESSMVSTDKEFDHFPSNEDVYQMISSIEKYIAENNGHVNGSPMLNINTEDSIHYSVMTAVPTAEEIQGNPNFKLKKMMNGNMLKMKITGGPNAIINARKQLHFYVEDYKRIPAAIPFETMVTNRVLVSDTSKWITELYYPVFY